jgi:hypothetical protein
MVHNLPGMVNHMGLAAARWEWRSTRIPARPRPKTTLKVRRARTQPCLGVAAALVGPFAAPAGPASRLGAAFDVGWVVGTEAGVRCTTTFSARSGCNTDARRAADVARAVGGGVGGKAEKGKGDK